MRWRSTGLVAIALMLAGAGVASGQVPANDDFASRGNLGSQTVFLQATSFGATAEAGEPPHDGFGPAASVWWSWTAPADGTVWLDTFGSDFDTVLAVYTGSSLGALAAVVSNDQGAGGVAFESEVMFEVTSGTVYQIAVDGKGGETGNIWLQLALVLAPAPVSNDAFADRVNLGGGASAMATGSNVGATAEAGEPARDGSDPATSVWWSWTAPGDGTVTLDTFGSDFDTVLAVYTGTTLAGLVEVASNDQAPGGGDQSVVMFEVTSGAVYQIVVDGWSGVTGNISLQLALELPPVSNDAFASRIDLGTGALAGATGSNVGASKEAGEPDHAGKAGGASVWWRWTAPADGTVTVDTVGSAFDTILAVYEGDEVGTLALVGENDDLDPGVLQSRVTFAGEARCSYSIAVDGYNGTQGDVTLRVFQAPSNDGFTEAIDLGASSTGVGNGSNVGGSLDVGESPHAGNPGGASVWWRWTAPADGMVEVDTVGSDFDTVLAVYRGDTVGGLTEVASDDNGGGGVVSRVEFSAEAGSVYRIAVDGVGGVQGNVVLSLRLAPPNDRFANASDLGGGSQTVVASNVGGTLEAGEPAHAGVGGGASVWWRWTAVVGGEVRVNTSGSGFDTLLAIYTGTELETLAEVASNNDSGGGPQSKLTFTAVAGVTYLVVVDGAGGANGDVALSLQSGPAGDLFAERVALGAGLEAAGSASNVGASAEVGEPRHAGDEPGATLWWTWTAPANGNATMDTFGSAIDTLLAVYEGEALGGLEEVMSNDDAGGGRQSEVSFVVTAGTVYQIAVDGFDGEQGDVVLNLRATAIGAPGNDDFAAATDLGVTAMAASAGDMSGATWEAGEEAHAGHEARRSLWWTWTAPAAGDAVLRFGSGVFVPRVAVYTGDALGALVEVASGDGSREVGFRAVAGATYRIAVDARSGGGFGAFVFSVVGLANDAFADRTAIAVGSGAMRGTNVGASREAGEPDHAGVAASGSVWWEWTAPTSGRVTIGTEGTAFDPILAVYTGSSLETLVEVGANDDAGPGTSESRVTFEAVAGTAYMIAVDGYGGGGGRVVVVVEGAAAVDPPPGNDAFANRAGLGNETVIAIEATNLGATGEVGEGMHAGRTAEASVWWTWTAAANGEVVVDTSGSGFDTVLAVYTGGVEGGLVEVASNDDTVSPASSQSEVRFAVSRGMEYQIVVDGPTAHRGVVRLNLRASLVAPPGNDAFAGRTDLGSGLVVFGGGDTSGATAEGGEPAHAGRPAERSAWWSWTAPVAGDVTLRWTGRGVVVPRVGLYTEDVLGSLEAVATAGVGGGVRFRAVEGTAYQIAVDTPVPGSSGAFSFLLVDLANDAVADAIELGTSFGAFRGTNVGATAEGGEPDHVGRTAGASVWWRWTAPESGRVTAGTLGSDFDTVMAIYSGAPFGGLVRVAGNDDAEPGVSQSQSSFQATGGVSYLIAIDGFGGAQGEVVLTLDRGGERPANDDFVDAMDLGGVLPAGYSNVGAGGEFGERDIAGQPATASLWWKWTPGATSDVTIDTAGSGIDTLLAVFRGNSLADLVEVVSNDDEDAGVETSRVAFRAHASTEYFVVVDGFSGQQGMVELGFQATVVEPPRGITVSGGGLVLLSEETAEIASGAPAPVNLATGKTAFAENVLNNGGYASHQIVHLNDGRYGNAHSWIGDGPSSFAGINLGATPLRLDRVAFGRSNVTTGDPCVDGFCTDRWRGLYTLEYTTEPNPDAGSTGWIAIGTLDYNAAGGSGFEAPYRRHLFAFDEVLATGFRLRNAAADVGFGGWIAIDEIELFYSGTERPGNDLFANREELGSGFGSWAGTNVWAGREPGEPDHAGRVAARSVWWRWTAVASGRVRVGTAGSDFDTVLAVYRGSNLANLVGVAKNDDAGAGAVQSEVSFDAVAGTTYAVVVGGAGGAQGGVVLTIGEGGAAPANDAFGARAALGSSFEIAVEGTNVGAGSELEEADRAGQVAMASVWWTWTAPVTCDVVLETAGSGIDTVLAVYRGGSLGALVEVASNDDAGTGGVASRVSFRAVGGESYAIAVDGVGGQQGAVRLGGLATPVPGSDARLAGLVVSAGVLSPRFSSDVTAYTVVVANGVTGLRVTPTVLSAAATVTVNGVAVPSGEVTGAIPLGVGPNVVTVVGRNSGADITYTVTVDRESAYVTWAKENGIGGGPLGNFDGDEDLNLSELGYGTDGAAANGGIAILDGGGIRRGSPVMVFDGDEPLVMFGRQKARTDMGLVYTVRFSADLVDWVVGSDDPVVLADDGEIEAVVMPFPRIGGVEAGYFQVGVATGEDG